MSGGAGDLVSRLPLAQISPTSVPRASLPYSGCATRQMSCYEPLAAPQRFLEKGDEDAQGDLSNGPAARVASSVPGVPDHLSVVVAPGAMALSLPGAAGGV